MPGLKVILGWKRFPSLLEVTRGLISIYYLGNCLDEERFV